MEIKIKRLTPTALIPTKAHESDACFDLYLDAPDALYHELHHEWNGDIEIKAARGIKIRPHETVMLHTGIAMETPIGYYAAIYARSGLASKHGLRPANCVGIVDAAYRGEVMVAIHNDSDETRIVHHNDRIAQMAILPVLDVNLIEADKLSKTERGSGGFGSSGK